MFRSSFARFAALFALGVAMTAGAAAQSQLYAAIAPEGRSSYVGGPPITFFVTALNATGAPLTGCHPEPTYWDQGWSYQTVDAGNQLIGAPDTPVALADGASQGFLLTLDSPTSTHVGVEPPRIECDGVSSARAYALSADVVVLNDPRPDIIAISATPSADGVVRLPSAGGRAAMAVAAVNIGAPGRMAVFPSDSYYMIGTTQLSVCETNPVTGSCIGPRTDEIFADFATDEVKTFAVFVQGPPNAGVPFYPDLMRVELNFELDGDRGWARGRTSAAVTGPPPPGPRSIAGLFSMYFEQDFETTVSLSRGLGAVWPDGRTLFWGDGGLWSRANGEWLALGDGNVDGRAVTVEAASVFEDLDDDIWGASFDFRVQPQTGLIGEYGNARAPITPGTPSGNFTGRYRGAYDGFLTERPVSAQDMVGRWQLISGGFIVGEMTVDASGRVSSGQLFGSAFGNCRFGGELDHVLEGRNFMDIELRFQGAVVGCAQPFNGNTFEGFATIGVIEGAIGTNTPLLVFIADRDGANRSGFSLLFVKA